MQESKVFIKCEYDEFADIIELVSTQVAYELHKLEKGCTEAELALCTELSKKGKMRGTEIEKFCNERNIHFGRWYMHIYPRYTKYNYHLELLQKMQQSYDKWNYGSDYEPADFEYGLGWSS